MNDREKLTANTCFIERSLVRQIIIGSRSLSSAVIILREVDALPIFTAEDFASLQKTQTTPQREAREATPVCCYCDAPLSCAQCGMEQAPLPPSPEDRTEGREIAIEAVRRNAQERSDFWYGQAEKQSARSSHYEVVASEFRHIASALAALSPPERDAVVESKFSLGDAVEVRKQKDVIDEIVIRRGDVHIEQMSADGWFMGVNASDGSYWQFWFGAKNGRSAVEFLHTEHVTAGEQVRKEGCAQSPKETVRS